MITVVFATRNGAGTLPMMLESLARLDEPDGGWALIAVDNGSIDETPAILELFEKRLPLQVLHQPNRGKNAALNLAIQHLRGDLVVFTDDDVIPRQDWLVHMHAAAAAQPDFTILGGRVEPIWPIEPPDWFFRVVPLAITFAITPEDLSDGPTFPALVFGPNMAIRRQVFDAGHRFDESIGPQPGQYCMGSETEFATRLSRHGYKAWHCSASRVRHIIRPYQMDPESILARANRSGRGTYRIERDQLPPGMPMLFGLPRWRVRRLLEETAEFMIAKVNGDFERCFSAQWHLQSFFGYLSEARCERRMASSTALRRSGSRHLSRLGGQVAPVLNSSTQAPGDAPRPHSPRL